MKKKKVPVEIKEIRIGTGLYYSHGAGKFINCVECMNVQCSKKELAVLGAIL